MGLRRLLPAAVVTTHAKPHARQQRARDQEVERAVMGQRCRPQRFSEVQRGNSSATSMSGFLLNSNSPAVQLQKTHSPSLRPACPEIRRWFGYMKTLFTLRTVIFWYPYSSTSMEWGLRRMLPAAVVTTYAKPHARQQRKGDHNVERAVMGQRCRPHRFREVQLSLIHI